MERSGGRRRGGRVGPTIVETTIVGAVICPDANDALPARVSAFEFTSSEGNMLILEQYDVDTRCIPEPSTIAMLLGLATMGLVALMRRRK